MVANRSEVQLSLDPINSADPALAIQLPLYVIVFGAVIAGMMFGALLTWFKQGKHRKNARAKKKEAKHWEKEAGAAKQRADELDPAINNDLPPALAKLNNF